MLGVMIQAALLLENPVNESSDTALKLRMVPSPFLKERQKCSHSHKDFSSYTEITSDHYENKTTATCYRHYSTNP